MHILIRRGATLAAMAVALAACGTTQAQPVSSPSTSAAGPVATVRPLANPDTRNCARIPDLLKFDASSEPSTWSDKKVDELNGAFQAVPMNLLDGSVLGEVVRVGTAFRNWLQDEIAGSPSQADAYTLLGSLRGLQAECK